jgi:hypothetical protein
MISVGNRYPSELTFCITLAAELPSCRAAKAATSPKRRDNAAAMNTWRAAVAVV